MSATSNEGFSLFSVSIIMAVAPKPKVARSANFVIHSNNMIRDDSRSDMPRVHQGGKIMMSVNALLAALFTSGRIRQYFPQLRRHLPQNVVLIPDTDGGGSQVCWCQMDMHRMILY